MNHLARLAFAVLLAAAVTLGCSGAGNSNNPGTGGTGGADPAFMAVAPCSTEASYTTTGTTIMFPNGDNSYAPKCLKVNAGATVTFAGDFASHPLRASNGRGTLTAHPIAVNDSGGMDNGTTAAFTFPNAGFYAYFCIFHGNDAAGTDMTGVIWVK